MSAAKIVVVKREQTRATLRHEDPDRDFWMSIRHTLLQQLVIIEKRLGIERRCRHCGNVN